MLLLKGDCLELMKTLPDKSVDLFICDLPYGCLTTPRATCGAGWRKEVEAGLDKTLYRDTGCDWDIKIDLEAFWIQVERLMKNDHTPIIQFCNTRFGYDLIKSKEKWFRYDLVWSKSRGVGFLCANKQPLRSHENIYVFAKKGATYYRKDIEGDFPMYVGSHSASKVYKLDKPDSEGYKKVDNGKRCVKSIINVKNETNKGKHPTAKPVDLYKFLIERYSAEGDTILDPTFGSGNSGRASVELNRKYIGMEKDEKFFTAYNTNASTQGRLLGTNENAS